jgi:hypothetical protein
MKQYDIYGNVTVEQHPQFEDKIVDPNKYYGSDLNRLCAEKVRKDVVVNNIDLIINDYKTKTIRIIESKHSSEKLAVGQKLLLEELSRKGIKTYCVYGNYPYLSAKIYSFQNKKTINVNQEQLIKFLDNK